MCALVAGHTNAEPAAERLRMSAPLVDADAASRALAEVTEAMEMIEREAALPAPFVHDHAATLRALGVEGATLEPASLVSAARTLESVRKLAAFLGRHREEWPRLAARCADAPKLTEIERKILDAFDDEPQLVDDASPALREHRVEVRRHRAALVDRLEKLIVRLPRVLVAADSRPTIREGRYVVPLRREALSEVPGIVHDESVSGATVFIEPQAVVEENNALRRAELAVRREEARILLELTATLAEHGADLEHAAQIAIVVETILARARYALATRGHAPELGAPELKLDGARHPLLVEHVTASGVGSVVPLDLSLGPEERTLIVSGPNTGGKTVLLKTIGVTALMAQSGIVPPLGPGSRMPWFDRVFADIGDAQSIAQDLSTFTAHLTKLKHALDEATASSLVLVDEIGGSTDPAEGSALAAALIEMWTERGARTVVTTHYHELKVLAATTEGVVNGSLAYDVERNLPQYRFVQGVPGRSFGLDLAERWGFGPVVGWARRRLESDVRDVEAVVDRLSREEAEHRRAREKLDAERRQIGEAATARAARETRVAEEHRRKAEQRLSELESQLERLRAEMKTQRRKLRRRSAELAEAEADAASARALAEEADRAVESLRTERDALTRERRTRPVRVGDRVRIPRYDVSGEVVEVDLANDAAVVRAGGIRISCRAAECELIEEAPPEPEPERETGAIEIEADADALPFEIDVRGMSADEVAFPVAGALEQAYHTGRGVVRIIHGKGLGVLRERVAELLKNHAYVTEFRLGQWNEGGAGVTIARIGDETGDDGQHADS